MRRIAAAALLFAVAACNKQRSAEQAPQADQALASDDLETNDLTAIDAVSEAASNMAADVDVGELGNDNASSDDVPVAEKAKPTPKAEPKPAKNASEESADTPAPADDQPANSDG